MHCYVNFVNFVHDVQCYIVMDVAKDNKCEQWDTFHWLKMIYEIYLLLVVCLLCLIVLESL